MNIPKNSFKLKLLTHCCLLSGAIYTSSSLVMVYAEETTSTTPVYAEFEKVALVGGVKEIDLTAFTQGNPVLAGNYTVSVYVNGEWQGEREYDFKPFGPDKIIEHCFNLKQLLSLGVDISKIQVKDQQQCLQLAEWIPSASSRMNGSELRYELSIPQAFLKQNARGYVPPEVWDRGINAGFLSYNLNTQQNRENHQTKTNSYLSLNAGINFAGWQLRHNAIATDLDGEKTEYESLNTYLQRAFPSIHSVLTVGESYTSGELFDSFGFTGVQLRSDDRMLPETQTGYAPIIRGVAQSNAIVEVRQNNQMIYQMSVAPGEFVINDLYPTGYGGEMQVTIREANGKIQRFNVPYASVNQMIRPGHHRYAVTLGQVRNKNLSDKDNFLEVTYQRGLNNYLTGYAGSILSEHYQAYQLGSAIATPIGAVALDVTHSDTDLPTGPKSSSQGQSYKLSYSKFWQPTNTNLTLAAYRYSTSGFYGFQDANTTQDYMRRGLSTSYIGRQKSQFQLALNQNLKAGWGSLYVTGTRSQYWDDVRASTDYQIGYNNVYKLLNYSLSMQKLTDMNGKKDDHYFLTLSMPLQFKRHATSISHTVSDYGNNTSVFGALTEDRALTYNASVSDVGYNNTSGNASLQYRSPYTTAALYASSGRDYQQWGVNLTGALVGHENGISFSPEMVDTMVLVRAENAKGAKINNTVGLKIDPWGYAVIPFVTPYRMNEISIDPRAVLDNVELSSTSQDLAPYAGSISRVEFKTKSGFPLLIKSKTKLGERLPFGATVFNSRGELVGAVTQGSQILIRTEALSDSLLVKWGDSAQQQCQVSYTLANTNQSKVGYRVVEGQCQ